MTRNGKIARLPYDIREELNKRILNGEPAEPLLEWLHDQDEVWDVLEKYFDEIEISEQNLSEWKLGGYQNWLANKEARETVLALARQSRDLGEASEEANMGQCLADLLMVEYIKLARVLVQKEEDPQKRVKQLGEVNRELCRLRGANARDVRTGIRRQRRDWEAEDRQAAADEKHAAWVKKQRLAKYQLLPVVAMLARKSKDKEAAWNVAAHEVEIEHDLLRGLLEKNHKDGWWFWDNVEERWEWIEEKHPSTKDQAPEKHQATSSKKKKAGKRSKTKSRARDDEPEDAVAEDRESKLEEGEGPVEDGEPPEGGTPSAEQAMGSGSIENGQNQTESDQIKPD